MYMWEMHSTSGLQRCGGRLKLPVQALTHVHVQALDFVVFQSHTCLCCLRASPVTNLSVGTSVYTVPTNVPMCLSCPWTVAQGCS